VTLTPGFGAVRDKLVRLDHTGARAAFVPVLANLAAYATALHDLGHPIDLGAAANAVAAAYGKTP
jgi:aspartate aminotransferase-like enzyme